MIRMTRARSDLWLVYDGECPVCTSYCTYIRLRETVGTLHLIDARKPSALMDEITRAGLDIDQGMVIKFHGTLYYGADAMRILAMLTTRSSLLNRLNYLLFSSRAGARVLYPIGKAFRTLVLKLLGIAYIGNLNTLAK